MRANMWGRGATLAIASTLAAISPVMAQVDSTPRRLSSIASWGYQLQGDMLALARSAHDLLVVDIDNVAWQTSTKELRFKPSGEQRLVVSYLSIGEAEDSRPYFTQCCATTRPPWLTDTTQGWPGNYAVRFWDPTWQAIVLDRIDAVINGGYDGVFLDRLDIWDVMAREQPTARADMIALVGRIAAHARARTPGFIILVQNAEELLDDAAHLATIDGIAKEDLFYGIRHDGKRNHADVIDHATRDLQRARAAAKPVLVVEYVPFDAIKADVVTEIQRAGFIPLIASRELDGN